MELEPLHIALDPETEVAVMSERILAMTLKELQLESVVRQLLDELKTFKTDTQEEEEGDDDG